MITHPILAMILQYPYRFWLIWGGLLLSAELLGAAGYLLWIGLSALLIGIIAWLVPLSWPWLWCGFSLLSLATALFWHYWQIRSTSEKEVLLNQPHKQLIGQQATIESPLVNGIGRLRIGDSTWRVQASEDLPIGSEVIVVAVQGITLQIVRRPSKPSAYF